MLALASLIEENQGSHQQQLERHRDRFEVVVCGLILGEEAAKWGETVSDFEDVLYGEKTTSHSELP